MLGDHKQLTKAEPFDDLRADWLWKGEAKVSATRNKGENARVRGTHLGLTLA